jgi:hypothetical protein
MSLERRSQLFVALRRGGDPSPMFQTNTVQVVVTGGQ